MTKRLLFTATLMLGFGIASTASADTRDLNCNSKIAHKMLRQMLDGERPAGWGAATPRAGARFDMRDPKTRAGKKRSRRHRGAWNELHLVRSHDEWGLRANIAFPSKVNTHTLVVACTYEFEYGSRAAKLVAENRTTLRFKSNKQASYYAAPMADSHRRARVTLLWVSPASAVAAGQSYDIRVSKAPAGTRGHRITRH